MLTGSTANVCGKRGRQTLKTVASLERSAYKKHSGNLHPHAPITASPAGCSACSWTGSGTEKNSQSSRSQSMSIGLRQHIGNNLCFPDLLPGCTNQWGSLQGRLDEYRRGLLQKEVNCKEPSASRPASRTPGTAEA